jgi:hypothetical protein
MPLWDGIQNYDMSTEQAALYTRIALTQGKGVDQTLNSHHFLYWLLGKPTAQGKAVFTGRNGQEQAVAMLGFERAVAANAPKVELVSMVGLSTGAALTVANSTNAQAVKTIDPIRKAEFDNFLYKDNLTISKVLELWRSARNVTPNEIDARIMATHEGFFSTLDTQLFSTAGTTAIGPSVNNVAALDFLLSDGLTVAERTAYWTAIGNADSPTSTPDETNYRQYIVDRKATGNEWARAIIRRTGTTLTSAFVRGVKRQLRDNGAQDLCLWVSPNVFDQLATELGNPANTGLRNEYVANQIQKFGFKDYLVIDNDLIVAYDKAIPNNRAYLLAQESWKPVYSILGTDTFRAYHLNYATQTEFITGQQILTDSPRKNAKIMLLA